MNPDDLIQSPAADRQSVVVPLPALFRIRLQSPARPAKEYFSLISVHSVSPEWKQGWFLWRK